MMDSLHIRTFHKGRAIVVLFVGVVIIASAFAQILIAQDAAPGRTAAGWAHASNNPVLESNYTTLDGNPGDPWVMRDPENPSQYLMYYGAATGDFSDELIRIFRATSVDGITWARSDSPVLVPTSGAWDATNVETPTVVVLPDKSFRMYYAGDRDPHAHAFDIGMATSRDGKTWEKSNQNPLLRRGKKGQFDSLAAFDPSVLLKDGRYWMWYAGISDIYQCAIGLATSTDGLTWEKHGLVLELDQERKHEDDAGITEPHVIWNGKDFEMFYVPLGPEGKVLGPIYRATSRDGKHWTKHREPILAQGTGPHWTRTSVSSPSVLLENGSYLMWYAGIDTDFTSYINAGFGHATKPAIRSQRPNASPAR